jgi:hypothetical protein
VRTANARVIADSITEDGHRITTFEATSWRPVLAEQNTHCVLARNSASSRAIPVSKQLKRFFDSIGDNPIFRPREQKGMQGGGELDGADKNDAVTLWYDLSEAVGGMIEAYVEAHPDPETRLHKSLLNRWLEVGLWQTQIITATQWDGYFWQRVHKDAEPHIRAMAYAIQEAREKSTPKLLLPGQWHLPYWAENGGHESDWKDAEDIVWSEQGDPETLDVKVLEIAKQCSTARCARVSYLTQSGIRDLIEDLRLYGNLTSNRVGSEDPPHASPLEHICTPWAENVHYVDVPGSDFTIGPLPRLGKMVGYLQLRHQVLGF